MIPAQAVEAAAKGLARHKWPTAIGVWESFGQGMQDDFRDQARAALEAAAPHIRAAAWDEGKDAVWAFLGNQDPQRARPTNPYRTPDAR